MSLKHSVEKLENILQQALCSTTTMTCASKEFNEASTMTATFTEASITPVSKTAPSQPYSAPVTRQRAKAKTVPCDIPKPVEASATRPGSSKEDPWTTVVRRKKRSVVLGTGNAGGCVRGAPRTRDLFVYRVDKTVTADDMQRFLSDSGVTVSAIELVSKDCARNCSFRVTVPLTNLDRIFDPMVWPAGIGVRFFRRRLMPK